MTLLDRFEHAMERLMEGTSGSLFRQPIQPAEIGKRLEREMLANRRASVGTSIAPNAFTVRLSPRDYEQFASYASGLSRQFEAWLAQVATERNLSVVDRIRVTIEADDSVRRRSLDVDASIIDARGPSPRSDSRSMARQPTAVFNVAPANRQATCSIVGSAGTFAGQQHEVPQGGATVGRGSECDIVLDAPDISRRHARIAWKSGVARIEDVNSTNGTYLNGDAIRIADVVDGDEVQFGSHRFHVRVVSEQSGRREFR